MVSPSLTWETFGRMPLPEVATLVGQRLRSLLVVADGTQRWFICEKKSGNVSSQTYWSEYMEVVSRQYAALLRLLFTHGVPTIFEPLVMPVGRSKEELKRGLANLPRIVTDKPFRRLYEELDIRVRFYGPWQSLLEEVGRPDLWEVLSRLTEETSHHWRHRLFWGVYVPGTSPQTEMVRFAVERARSGAGSVSRDQLVVAYYGEPVEPVEVAILLAGQPRAASYLPPFLGDDADFYFTINSPLGMDALQLRAILYDKLFARREAAREYMRLSPQGLAQIRELYERNRGHTLGIGRWSETGQFWYPLPQVNLPPTLMPGA
ncbi:MAG: hypothetical protein D6759_15375 [Chloroflexi bacterium]|nr:MAG: hypothetical protein D6759_15375 [Chloroflexota bacterium]